MSSDRPCISAQFQLKRFPLVSVIAPLFAIHNYNIATKKSMSYVTKCEQLATFVALISGGTYPNFRNYAYVCNVRAPYSGGWNFRQHFFAILYLWASCKILRRSSPSVWGVKRNRGSKLERCHFRVSHLLVSFLYFFIAAVVRRNKLYITGSMGYALNMPLITLSL